MSGMFECLDLSNDSLMTILDPRPSEMMTPEAGASGLAWKRIAEALEEDIRAGRHAVGSLLPPSAQLAQRFGVHRHTVRQAFKHLAERGLVSVERGRGTEVLAQRFPYRLGRRVSLRTNFGAAGLTVTGRILSVAQGEASRAVSDELGLAPGAPIHLIRTVNAAEGIPVSSGMHSVCATRYPDFPAVLARHGASFSAAFAAYGIPDYLRLTTRLSARLASEAEAEWLDLPVGSPVLHSIGLDALPDHTPLQRVDGVFAGARMEMIVEPAAEPAA